MANLDYPLAKNSFAMRETGIGEHAYLRLHGRNAAAWFDRKAGRDETYNYCYSEDELDEDSLLEDELDSELELEEDSEEELDED